MVMQRPMDFLVGGSNPGTVNMPPRPQKSGPTRIRTAELRPAVLPFDQQLCVNNMLPHCLEPSQQKLLTPPQHPPAHPHPQKSDI